MMVAQGLYEGVKLSDSETVGLITYMRTDSTRISTEAMQAACEHIENKYGKEYIPQTPNIYKTKKNSQDAHEAIRQSYVSRTPESLKSVLSADQYKLYRLIYTRFIASQMTNALYETISAEIVAGDYNFRASGSRLLFKGFTAVYKDDEEEQEGMLPKLEENAKCLVRNIDPKQNFTKPPARYSEATLVKALEERGIGRPSTYVPIIGTILDRGYVKKEQKLIVPTELGEIVTKLMIENFPDVVDVEFTATMEEQLDDIEADGRPWKKVIGDFYTGFEQDVKKAEESVQKIVMEERPAGIECDLCGAQMVYKTGRYGEFIACPNYPECKNTKQITKPIEAPCPTCGGQVLTKKSKKGKTFYGCANYPTCTFVSWDMPIEEKCSECSAYMVVHRQLSGKTYKRCSNEKCKNHSRQKPEETKQSENKQEETKSE